MGADVAFQAGKVSVLEERFVLQHEIAGEKWSLRREVDAVRRLDCLAGDRGKEYQNVPLLSRARRLAVVSLVAWYWLQR